MANNNNGNNKGSTIMAIIVIILILVGIGYFMGGGSSSSSNGEVRCWYCSKVIYNNGRAIHCSHKSLNTYICNYCGKTNVIK